LPQIEALSPRGETLAPLIVRNLQKARFDFQRCVKGVCTETSRGPTTINIEIFGEGKDVKEIAGELDDHLRALLGPS
jgi:hypothetical protein